MNIQLIVTSPISSSIWTEPNRQVGDVVWVRSEEAARHLIEAGFCRLPGSTERAQAPAPGPSEVKPAGPSEAKSPRPKSFGEAPRGRSIASPLSNPPGAAILSSASRAAPP